MNPNLKLELQQNKVGVVGLGLMGSSIAIALLISGHEVIGLAPIKGEIETAEDHLDLLLDDCKKKGLLEDKKKNYLNRLTLTEDYKDLKECKLVLECVIEDKKIKKEVYRKIEAHLNKDSILATNTSAIPVSLLQEYLRYPQRFLGIHWAEPAYASRFLEITRGEKTKDSYLSKTFNYALLWKKEPTVIKKDIRGFLTNRLMYAATRELFSLVESKKISIEDADKAFRYDAGAWMTFMGIFKRMRYLGIENFKTIFKNIFPLLDNSETVPEKMKKLEKMNARGVHDKVGFYPYDDETAKEWIDAFADFNEDVFKLAEQYPSEKKNMI